MTRINVIPPERLTDQHLLAEYRELPRVFPLAQAAITRGIVIGPESYTLGKGHILFFYSRTDYLSDRQGEIIRELLDRGFDLAHRDPPARLVGCGVSGWKPDAQAVAVNLARLRERLQNPPRPGYYTLRGVPVPSTFYDFAPCPWVIDLQKPISGGWEGRGFGRRFIYRYQCSGCGGARNV